MVTWICSSGCACSSICSLPSRHKSLKQCWFNVGPPSTTLNSFDSTPCVCWDVLWPRLRDGTCAVIQTMWPDSSLPGQQQHLHFSSPPSIPLTVKLIWNVITVGWTPHRNKKHESQIHQQTANWAGIYS